MRRTELLQEVRQMRFEEAYGGWKRGSLTQEEAARILGVCDRTFRRYTQRFDDGGMEALLDKRISQASYRKAPVDEVVALAERYRKRYRGWNVCHFHFHHRRERELQLLGTRERDLRSDTEQKRLYVQSDKQRTDRRWGKYYKRQLHRNRNWREPVRWDLHGKLELHLSGLRRWHSYGHIHSHAGQWSVYRHQPSHHERHPQHPLRLRDGVFVWSHHGDRRHPKHV